MNQLKGFFLLLKINDNKGNFVYQGKKWMYELRYNSNQIYLNDKILFEDNSYLILLDGVILNKLQLMQSNDIGEWRTTLIFLYKKYGESFFTKMLGSFSGLLLDKKLNNLIIFGDHIGSKPIFYFKNSECFIFSTNIAWIYDYLCENGVATKLSLNSAYSLLSYGYMLGNSTLSEEVLKMCPGTYILLQDDFKEITYYKLDNTPDYSITEQDAIELIDEQFRRSIKLQFEKDIEYRLKHFVALSGGLDSRMTSWVAHEMGYTNQLNFTFSQSGYLDEEIAQTIASDLGHDWIFKSLDTGNYLFDVDEVTEVTGGNILYYACAHANSLIKLLSLDESGMLHSGLFGDAVVGTYYSHLVEGKPFVNGAGSFSHKFIPKVKVDENIYPNEEIGVFYLRGFNGILYAGHSKIQQTTETISPFYHKDFLDTILKIPLKYRWAHNIYKKWIIQKYTSAAHYKWEKIDARITDFQIRIGERDLVVHKIPKKIINKLWGQTSALNTKQHMNPMEYHINHNDTLRKFYDDYFVSTIDLVSDESLAVDLHHLYNEGTIIEKVQAISLLSAIKRFHFR